ncbi:MAG: site-specific integrase [Magnetococcales bacterium]|nr:site-specific integrase [Magnetococcales bacterium]
MNDVELLPRFLDDMLVEHGLSANTLEAYRHDLEGLADHLQRRGTGWIAAGRDDLAQWLEVMVRERLAPASMARKRSSAGRMFRWLAARELRLDDPTDLLEGPKRGRRLPKVLSEADVEALLAAPDRNDDLGLRDAARRMSKPCSRHPTVTMIWGCAMPRGGCRSLARGTRP